MSGWVTTCLPAWWWCHVTEMRDIKSERSILVAERSFAGSTQHARATGAGVAEGVGHLARSLYMMVFFMVAAGAVIMGIAGLRFVSDANAGATEVSVTCGVLSNSIKANDSHGSIYVGEGPEGDSLVMRRLVPTLGLSYETRIYLYQGFVVQEFGLEGRPYAPQDATKLVASKAFSVSIDGGAVHASTDDEDVTVALRSLSEMPPVTRPDVVGEGGVR